MQTGYPRGQYGLLPRVSNEAEQGESLLGTSLKVITCGLGSGILVMPWGAAGASLLVSHGITALVLLANAWSVMIIVHAVDRWGGAKVWDESQQHWIGTHRRPGYRINDFGQLLRQAPWPLPACALVWDVIVNMSNAGALVGYMIVVGDTMAAFISSGCPDFADRWQWISVGSAICLPLCIGNPSFLSYSSAIGVAANLYLFMVLARALVSEGVGDRVCAFGLAPGILTCISNLFFSVVLQMCIPEFYTQLRREDQDPKTFLHYVIIPSFTFTGLLMCAFSTVGYLAYGANVSSNVLANLPGDAWGKSTQIAMCIACLMVYPNMLRPMVPPIYRIWEWISMENCEPPDIYEGRLIHTELQCGHIELDMSTGEITIEVADTCGFEKDALIFVDGIDREYAVVKEVIPGPLPSNTGRLRLRPLYGAHPQEPVLNEDMTPCSSLQYLQLPIGSKVVLDEDPVLVNAAVAGERCLHMNYVTGITRGVNIQIGEGARKEKGRVIDTLTLKPEAASTEGHLRTHDLVLVLENELKHNHGAHTHVILDNGRMDVIALGIVASVMAMTYAVNDLGVVNVANGAISVAVIVGGVPGLCALCLNTNWKTNGSEKPLPVCFRFQLPAYLLVIISVIVGTVCAFFVHNHANDLDKQCHWQTR
jgi:hypothetical protein